MLLLMFIIYKCIKFKTRAISLQNLSEQGREQLTSEMVKMVVDSFMILLPLFLGIKAITTAIVQKNLTACSDGSLTLPVEPVNKNLIVDLYWKYRYTHESDWTTVVYCNKTMAGCAVTTPVLPDGTRVSRGANQSLTVEHRSRQNTSRDNIQFQFEVHLTDDSVRRNIFEVNFTIVCVPTWIDGELNLTRVLFDIYPLEQLVEIELYDENGTRFAYINTESGATTDVKNNKRQMPAFRSRLKVIDRSLLLTAIQKTDNGTKMKSKAHLRDVTSKIARTRSNTEYIQVKTIQILVHTPGFPSLKPSSHSIHVSSLSSTIAVRSLWSNSTPAATIMPNGASGTEGQLWTVILTSVVVFLCLYLR